MVFPPIGAIFAYVSFGLCVFNLAVCVYSLISRNYKNIRITNYIAYAIFIFSFISLLNLAWLIIHNAFEYKLVYETANLTMPLNQKLTGLWANQNSSLNFWCFLLIFFSLVSQKISRSYQSDKDQLVSTLIFMFLVIVFSIPVHFILNPFSRLWISTEGVIKASVWVQKTTILFKPENGIGLNPNLRHTAMMIHPPFLYVGLLGFFVPYIHALVDLIAQSSEGKWQTGTFKLSLFSWICLTFGMALGSWWAYTILGWGGYWGWDAVEIAGLIPWLLAVSYIHSVYISRARNTSQPYILISLVFLSTLIGIVITRSGIIESIHAYAKGPVGIVLSILILIFFLLTIVFLIKKKRYFQRGKDSIWMSMSTFLLVGLSLFYFFGQTFPISTSILLEKRLIFPIELYKHISTPFFVAILFSIFFYYFKFQKKYIKSYKNILMGISLIFSGVITYLFNRNRSIDLMRLILFFLIIFLIQYFLTMIAKKIILNPQHKKDRGGNRWDTKDLGSLFIHFGFMLLLLGIFGVENASKSFSASLSVGESFDFDNKRIVAAYIQQFSDPEPKITYESSYMLLENGKVVAILTPKIYVFDKLQLKTIEPGLSSNFVQDIQIVLRNWEGYKQKSNIDIMVFPLALWIWIGCGTMCFGGIVVLLQRKHVLVQ